ncbi:hypothetical protein [Fictibacillus norfolkensis]|jgi:hypothetical protein|uniref:Uncharacterized protein n=1 Tax=Fictibacillus norfolkensis TaxID=2762233 RepID=A0ABR8SPS2_9BACL|nr:hypothetical protein [Fictibacillus norfolkensis]MBD7965457.1 hypothetical protein [Fictibacillus norfolkensis]
MLLFLLLCLLTAGFFIEIFQKHILKIKEPDIRSLWEELDKQDWYNILISDSELAEWIELDKKNGLLKDPYYVRKVLDKPGHREGYIQYIKSKID